ncbi:MAG: Asp-tRNA(Asn)/Glu-tRNA(Gln) amidotransferase subunit GatC [Myxococcota bacterium]
MARISRDEVERVVALARLSMDEAELTRAQSDLLAILEYVETLEGLDTEGVPPTSHVLPMPTPLRDDEPASPLDPALAVANAPEASGSAFVVPKVIAGEEEG